MTPTPPTTVISPEGQTPQADWRELWAVRDLWWFLIRRDLKTRYSQSVLGLGWAIIQPLFTMGVLTLIFGKLAGDLKIQPVKVGFAAFYESIGRVDLTENHKEEKPISISGKQVRETLVKGEQVDPRIMRPTTSKILGEAMKGK